MAENLKNKKFKAFWNDVYKVKKNNDVLPSKIDGDSNYDNIANNFASKYKRILDQGDEGVSSADLYDLDVRGIRFGEIGLFSVKDIKSSLKLLKPGIGCDNAHTNHLLCSPDSFLDLLAKLFQHVLSMDTFH